MNSLSVSNKMPNGSTAAATDAVVNGEVAIAADMRNQSRVDHQSRPDAVRQTSRTTNVYALSAEEAVELERESLTKQLQLLRTMVQTLKADNHRIQSKLSGGVSPAAAAFKSAPSSPNTSRVR